MEFKIPAIPPSVNQHLKINYRRRCVYLDPAVKKFKVIASMHIPPITFKPDVKLKVEVEYHGQFINKSNKKTKRRDGQNLDKCLYDAMFEKFGINDCHAWEGSWKKVHNNEQSFTLVNISELED